MDPVTKSSLKLNEAEQHNRAARLLAQEAARELALAEQKRKASGHRFSIVRAVRAMTRDGEAGLFSGYEAEVAQETAARAGRPHDPARPMLPWGALLGERTLQVGTGSLGGYMVGTSADAWDALAPYSITMQAGVTLLSGLVGNVVIGRETPGTSMWIAETGSGTASELTLGGVTLTPKSGIGYMAASGRLLKQAPDVADALVARSLRRELGLLVDQAIVAGTSTDSTVPLGVRYTSGVTVSTGTGANYATMLAEQKAVAAANVLDSKHTFIGNPDARELLAARDCGTSGARYLWDNDRIVNRPAYVTPAVPTKVIVHGDWSQVALGLWGNGFVLEHNPFANFAADIHGFRIMVACDVGVLQPTAVRCLVGIT